MDNNIRKRTYLRLFFALLVCLCVVISFSSQANIEASTSDFVERIYIEPDDLAENKELENWVLVLIVALVLSIGLSLYVIILNRMANRAAESLRQDVTVRKQAEQASATLANQMRLLYKASSMPAASFEEQINQVLKTGNKLLDTEIADVCKVDGITKELKIIGIVTPRDFRVNVGDCIPLDQSYCGIAYLSGKLLHTHHVAESNLAHHRAYRFSHIEMFIAVPLWVNGKKYGTIRFSSRRPSNNPIPDCNLDMAKLIARWVGVTIEHQMAEQIAIDASRAKSEYLTNMSHDLRTPLSAIIGYSEMLTEEAAEQQQTETVKYLTNIHGAGKHLLKLINGILDLAKVEAGKMELALEKVDVKQILADVATTIQPLANKNSNVLDVFYTENIGEIMVDSTKLRQLLLNFLDNAVKFTEHGTVQLTAEREYLENIPWIVFIISDTGIGLSQDQIGKLFKDFSQADPSTTRLYGGTGLGLAISQRFCNMMGGEITVESKLGKGTIFKIYLPIISEKIGAPKISNEPPLLRKMGT